MCVRETEREREREKEKREELTHKLTKVQSVNVHVCYTRHLLDVESHRVRQFVTGGYRLPMVYY